MRFNEKALGREMNRAFDTHDAAALLQVAPLVEQLKDDPDQAIDRIFLTYNNALNDAYAGENGINRRAFIESLAGGPNEVVPSAVYNAVGAVYPYLERPQRDKALRQILNILDGINYRYVQSSHTPFIREPLLLADITICRGIYWPGLEEGVNLMKRYSCFAELKEKTIDEEGLFRKNKVKSDFVLAAALVHGKNSSWGNDYIDTAHPEFLNRVFKGIVAIDFARTPPEEFESIVKEFHEVWPERFCKRIEPIRQEADWVDYSRFR